ncbi:peptidyl-prolyl cis-trans isomerase B (cyclophilin B) [Geothermobacter ehrlichii]|uniref:Peptidyl-prolyl cis-trans isomerase n=1 Tax=Geothermobacter ehrlichii TaxID=213224 RepID=A0A5D3WJZ0_9BACT|nr:peptidylprolyl isomerase [Geothermobacter ehrlichii]TYO98664.1 peptidyl-prolyl cis-trans isomerase B (cyclophilin B) [Geothermobacter ehrlichii]
MTDKNPQVRLRTSKGDITLELDAARAPETVANFLAYVDDGFYVGTIFHRVIDGFMIQGGGLDAELHPKTAGRPPIRNEADNGLSNARGTIAMARTSDPHSATSQFFINVSDNDLLDHSGKNPQGWGYCVFGRVVEGMETVDAIRQVATGTRGMYQDVPKETIMIEGAERLN